MAAPHLAGGSHPDVGSGRRLREILHDPIANLGFVHLDPGGRPRRSTPRRAGCLRACRANSTRTWPCTADQVALTGTNFHAVDHAQPRYLTYLSHIANYREESYLNRQHPALGA